MDKLEPSVSVCGWIARTRWQPGIQVGQSDAGGLALFVIVAIVADVWMDDTVGVEVRFIADPAVPAPVVPS